jgi:hypothetical protein
MMLSGGLKGLKGNDMSSKAWEKPEFKTKMKYKVGQTELLQSANMIAKFCQSHIIGRKTRENVQQKRWEQANRAAYKIQVLSYEKLFCIDIPYYLFLFMSTAIFPEMEINRVF